MKKLTILLLGLAIVVFFSAAPQAAEHPGEHPGTKAAEDPGEHPGTKAAEHPGMTAEEHQGPGARLSEHPGETKMLSADKIIKGIKAHIKSVTDANNGVFPLPDAKEGKDLKLKLVKVHENKVSYIKKDDAYFACTDFVTTDGSAKYDVDFWMKESKNGTLEVYMTKVHKKDGSPRFTYKDDEIVEVK